jgi:hypothetical protein
VSVNMAHILYLQTQCLLVRLNRVHPLNVFTKYIYICLYYLFMLVLKKPWQQILKESSYSILPKVVIPEAKTSLLFATLKGRQPIIIIHMF